MYIYIYMQKKRRRKEEISRRQLLVFVYMCVREFNVFIETNDTTTKKEETKERTKRTIIIYPGREGKTTCIYILNIYT